MILNFIVLILLTLCIGSFLNVVIYRLPIMIQHQWRKECHEYLNITDKTNSKQLLNLFLPRSHCQKCKTSLRFWHNIPILSYLFLRGKCSNCQAHISLRYPLIEVTTVLLSFAVAWHFGWNWQMSCALLFTWALICLALIDYDYQLLPDGLTLTLLWFGLIVNSYGVFTDLNSALLGTVAGYLSLWFFAQLFKLITGKVGMGNGDFKLFAAFGAWFGWQYLLLIIILASFTGAVIGISLIILAKRDHQIPIPFGPFLTIAGWITLLWGPMIMNWYLS